MSRTSTSFPNRERTLPVGVVSKKDIGERITPVKRAECIASLPFRHARCGMISVKRVSIPVAIQTKNSLKLRAE